MTHCCRANVLAIPTISAALAFVSVASAQRAGLQGVRPHKQLADYVDECEKWGTWEASRIRRSSPTGSPTVDYCLGTFYERGIFGFRKDPEMSVKYYLSAAQANYPPAETELGVHYGAGNGVPQDYGQYLKWLRLAAEQDFPAAQVDLGQAYAEGRGVQKDLKQARKWYTLAANNGSTAAANNLAKLDVVAAPQRIEPAQDLFNEGRQLYNSGKKDASVRPFLAAAQAGNSKAQVQIAWHYLNGVGVPANAIEAAKWYRAAAERGNSDGMFNLGLLYEKGKGVREDWVEAAKWYTRSADLANSRGQRLLAYAYQFGIGVPQSRELAIQWGRRAQAQGDGQAGWWAKSLSGGGPIGFYAPEERNLFATLVFPKGLEPRGILFHNFGERMAFVSGVASHFRSSSRGGTSSPSSHGAAAPSGSGCGDYCGNYAAANAYKVGESWAAEQIKNGTATQSERDWYNR